jgi:hypothetical protein
MSYFAQVENNIVIDVIRIEQSELDTGLWGDPAQWIQTSYNTRGGIYYIPNSNPPEPDPDQSKALRANYAGIGYTYDAVNDVFYSPQPYSSWIINAPTWMWQAPVPYPQDGKDYTWDEATLSWVEITVPPPFSPPSDINTI